MATTHVLRPARQTAGATATMAKTRLRPRWFFELTIVAILYVAYEGSRASTPSHPALALRHAHYVISAENSLHLGAEATINRLFAMHGWLGTLGGYYYALFHFIVTITVLVWLYVRRPELYSSARTMLALATFGALVVYMLYPVTPPRLAIPGMTDIIVTHNVFDAAHAGKSGGFVNIYAAMPSLHVGWAVWSALWIIRSHSGSKWRHLVWLYPLTTTFVVLGTANHYVLDALAGFAFMVVAAALASQPIRTWIAHRTAPMMRTLDRRFPPNAPTHLASHRRRLAVRRAARRRPSLVKRGVADGT